jgi:two-component system, LytTR family, sensor kinase
MWAAYWTGKAGAASDLKQAFHRRPKTIFLHPALFISGWIALGALFAAQEWITVQRWGYHLSARILFASWCVEYLVWGVLFWALWRFFWTFLLGADLRRIFTLILPLSMGVAVLKEMIWVPFFPNEPLDHAPMAFWQRLGFHLSAQFIYDLVVFWCTFLLFRGFGYYQMFRENERTAAQLETQLANARLSALRMQLNPHFLFNAMNSISSLMRTDIEAADEMLEQLSSLLRMSLERGTAQLITLREEIEFLEVFLLMQDRRYAGRVTRHMSIDPELYDALVPAMILQPIVENAYVHGLSKIDKNAELSIEAHRNAGELTLTVTNSGIGLKPHLSRRNGQGIGIANVRDRLRLHYADTSWFEMQELDRSRVAATLVLPLSFATSPSAELARYGVE